MTNRYSRARLPDLEPAFLRGKMVFVRCDLNVPLEENMAKRSVSFSEAALPVIPSASSSGFNPSQGMMIPSNHRQCFTYKISNDAKVRSVLDSLRFLTRCGAKVVVASHMQQPKAVSFHDPGAHDHLLPENHSLKQVRSKLASYLDECNVYWSPDCIGPLRHQLQVQLQDGDILLLENVRKYSEEIFNDPLFASELAEGCDLVVNEAFASSHRDHASVSSVHLYTTLRLNVIGFHALSEVVALSACMYNPRRPFAAIVGGAKISSKLPLLMSLLKKVDKLLVGGAMVFTFLAAQNHQVSSSRFEPGCVPLAKQILESAVRNGTTVVLACDFVCLKTGFISERAFDFTNMHTQNEDKGKLLEELRSLELGSVKTLEAHEFPPCLGWAGVDIGPKTIALFSRELKDCSTILWNGPMGRCEEHKLSTGEVDSFCHGTDVLIDVLRVCSAKHGATTIACGGDTVAAIERHTRAAVKRHFTHRASNTEVHTHRSEIVEHREVVNACSSSGTTAMDVELPHHEMQSQKWEVIKWDYCYQFVRQGEVGHVGPSPLSDVSRAQQHAQQADKSQRIRGRISPRKFETHWPTEKQLSQAGIICPSIRNDDTSEALAPRVHSVEETGIVPAHHTARPIHIPHWRPSNKVEYPGFSHVSLAGGGALQYLEGRAMPGLDAVSFFTEIEIYTGTDQQMSQVQTALLKKSKGKSSSVVCKEENTFRGEPTGFKGG